LEPFRARQQQRVRARAGNQLARAH
jgi:hypothetical protein